MLGVAGVVLLSLFCVTADEVVLNDHYFPEGFSLGAATAAYQIEGGWNEGGKGEHIWDWFMHNFPEKIENGATGDIACNSYHKWQEDIELLKNLNVDHYRLSISWSRLLPTGYANEINTDGLTYYRNVLEGLINANITPYVTLYHWDLPIRFHELGGWQNPLIADRFAEYARLCFQLFGDLVKNWITLNEPHTYCVLGYDTGVHAPGYEFHQDGIYRCAYTSVLAHAQAYHIYYNEFAAAQGGRISIVLDSPWFEPATDSNEDQDAVQRGLDFFFGLYANPIYNGNWPEQVITIVDYRSQREGFSTSRLPKFTDEELEFIKGTADVFFLNTYSTYLVSHHNYFFESIDSRNASFDLDQGVTFSVDPSWSSDVDWVHLVPSGFRKLLNYVYNSYGKQEIIVTENGWAQNITTAGLKDQGRITYISQYLSALLDAVYEDGVNVTGYTAWSIMDNLEWSHGYSQKLGFVQVDFNDSNRTRTAKDSYYWFQKVAQNKCLLEDVAKCV